MNKFFNCCFYLIIIKNFYMKYKKGVSKKGKLKWSS